MFGTKIRIKSRMLNCTTMNLSVTQYYRTSYLNIYVSNNPGPNCPGPNCPHLKNGQLGPGQLSPGPNCPGPNCPPLKNGQLGPGQLGPGPNCPGPNCPGPSCPGPDSPGPNLPRIIFAMIAWMKTTVRKTVKQNRSLDFKSFLPHKLENFTFQPDRSIIMQIYVGSLVLEKSFDCWCQK